MATRKCLLIMAVVWLTALLVSAGGQGACSAAGGADPKQIVIKIGCNFELSGGIGSFGQEALNGARLAVKEANDSGGVLGRQIELVERDNGSEPSQSANVMAALVSQDKVIAVIGPVASSNALAAAPVASWNRIPMVSSTATNPRVTVEQGSKFQRAVGTDPGCQS